MARWIATVTSPGQTEYQVEADDAAEAEAIARGHYADVTTVVVSQVAPPSGEMVALDDCSLSVTDMVRLWGGHGGVEPPKISRQTGGPEGKPFYRFLLSEGDRDASEPKANERNEVGSQSSTTSFIRYELGGRYVTHEWLRLPAIDLGSAAGEGRTIQQMKHIGSGEVPPISPSPPLSVQQMANGVLRFKERSEIEMHVLHEEAVTLNEWHLLSQDVTYALDGQIAIWIDGELVAEVEAPTVKLNANRYPMRSTLRRGIYQPAAVKAAYRDAGPCWVERI